MFFDIPHAISSPSFSRSLSHFLSFWRLSGSLFLSCVVEFLCIFFVQLLHICTVECERGVVIFDPQRVGVQQVGASICKECGVASQGSRVRTPCV